MNLLNLTSLLYMVWPERDFANSNGITICNNIIIMWIENIAIHHAE